MLRVAADAAASAALAPARVILPAAALASTLRTAALALQLGNPPGQVKTIDNELEKAGVERRQGDNPVQDRVVAETVTENIRQ